MGKGRSGMSGGGGGTKKKSASSTREPYSAETGKGWRGSYHVDSTDRYGGMFVDEGTVGYTNRKGDRYVISVGDEVTIPGEVRGAGFDQPINGTINKIHIYPNGGVSVNVRFEQWQGSGKMGYYDGLNADPEDLTWRKRKRR